MVEGGEAERPQEDILSQKRRQAREKKLDALRSIGKVIGSIFTSGGEHVPELSSGAGGINGIDLGELVLPEILDKRTLREEGIEKKYQGGTSNTRAFTYYDVPTMPPSSVIWNEFLHAGSAYPVIGMYVSDGEHRLLRFSQNAPSHDALFRSFSPQRRIEAEFELHTTEEPLVQLRGVEGSVDEIGEYFANSLQETPQVKLQVTHLGGEDPVDGKPVVTSVYTGTVGEYMKERANDHS